MKNAVEFLECSQVNEINNGCRTRIGSFIKNELVKLQWPNLLILSIVYFSILLFYPFSFLASSSTSFEFPKLHRFNYVSNTRES